MKYTKLLAGILIFGSLWGFAECIIGSLLRDFTWNGNSLPAGALMTGIFAIGLMTLSRVIFRQPGMQAGMGLVAGALRLFNPFGGCYLCSAIAIMAEGVLFDIIWTGFALDQKKTYPGLSQLCFGITSSYIVYIGGYFVTQTLTPVFSNAGFHVENLIAFIPNILASGLFAALLGALIVPLAIQLKQLDITIKDRLYYPITIGVSATCWAVVIVNTLIVVWL
jgi:hypothetical protein